MKSGFVAIIGKPNAGKSTILNALLERDIAIVTNKAQTTRNTIRGIYDDGDYQIVFVDTPGIHKARHSLGKIMNQDAFDSTKNVDAIVLVIDASKKFNEGDRVIMDTIQNNIPLFLVINKIDLMRLPEIEDVKKTYSQAYPQAKLIEMSAIENFNIDLLLNEIKKVIKDGPRYYPEDAISDKDAAFYVSEIIREKLLKYLKEEVPHELAVRVDNIEHKKDEVFIKATIIVDRDSHKGIVIGKGGKMIRMIGTKSRKTLEEYFNKHIFLELFVSVKEDWINNPRILKELGYK
ncbi:MAG TPA: GTPase Era [Firmicutes bacterium]|nr:GTPase Era [Bacillota bacterium]